ncbi:MAG: hypothetical protein MJ113_02225 [Lachnospiraceae bacterium]|nr:hypothetical protein [Lachnospiraceae bacterium]
MNFMSRISMVMISIMTFIAVLGFAYGNILSHSEKELLEFQVDGNIESFLSAKTQTICGGTYEKNNMPGFEDVLNKMMQDKMELDVINEREFYINTIA